MDLEELTAAVNQSNPIVLEYIQKLEGQIDDFASLAAANASAAILQDAIQRVSRTTRRTPRSDTGGNTTTLSHLLQADPGLPRPNPTIPYWISESPDLLSSKQSASFIELRDIVIIGSGITAASVSRTLLELDDTCTISILEARNICSGATGRNGGHLITYGGANYSELKATLGKEMATKIVDFTFKNIERTKELVEEFHSPGCDEQYRDVTRLRSFADKASYEEAKASIAEFEEDNPSMAGQYQIVECQNLLSFSTNMIKICSIPGVEGRVLQQAGALWPYRFVTNMYHGLLESHPTRLTLEANTPVTSVSHAAASDGAHPYTVHTPRGQMRAKHVIYCTNGYASHLLPSLRGAIFPYRGTMTVQDLSSQIPNIGHNTSWSLHHHPIHDPSTGLTRSGTYYLQHNAETGMFFFGGENTTKEMALTADDSVQNLSSVVDLREMLPRMLGMEMEEGNELTSCWTGVMGFTSDDLPLVGNLGFEVTGRDGKGEWIAAGFNGMGMSMCVLAGEAVAKMVLGEDVSAWLPGAFEVSKERLAKTLSLQRSEAVIEDYWPSSSKERGSASRT